MEEISFSIIIPVYNREDLIKRAVGSFLQQDYTSYEIILVDDGSTDGSRELCDELAACYDFIKVVHQANQGAASARNSGLEIASKEYVLFCDSDDYYEIDSLQKMANAMEAIGKIDILVFGFKTSDGYPLLPSGYPYNEKLDKIYIKNNMLPYELGITPSGGKSIMPFVWNKAYRRSTLERCQARFIDGLRVWEDKMFWIMMLGDIESVAILDQCFYNYKSDAETRLTTNWNPQILEKVPMKFHILQDKYGKEFDFENEYVVNGYANMIVEQVIQFFNCERCTDVEVLKTALDNEKHTEWLERGTFKDYYKKKIAKFILNDDFGGVQRVICSYSQLQERKRKIDSIEKQIQIFKYRVRKLCRVIAGKEKLS